MKERHELTRGVLSQIAANIGKIAINTTPPKPPTRIWQTATVIINRKRWISELNNGGRFPSPLRGVECMELEADLRTHTIGVHYAGNVFWHPILKLNDWFNIPVHAYPHCDHIIIRIDTHS